MGPPCPRLARIFVRPPAAARLGRHGERLAARALRRSGYRLLARNLRTPAGEIDLLAECEGALVVVEVKSGRRGRAALEARLARRQRRRLWAAGRWLVRRRALRAYRLRVDLVTVTFDARRPVVTIRRNIGRP